MSNYAQIIFTNIKKTNKKKQSGTRLYSGQNEVKLNWHDSFMRFSNLTIYNGKLANPINI